MTPESRIFVRDLVSYTAVVLLALFVFGTIWYLRSKFRKLSILNRTIAMESIAGNAHQRINQFQLNLYAASIINPRNNNSSNRTSLSNGVSRSRRVTIQGDSVIFPYNIPQIIPNYALPYDPPPSYSSLKFPEIYEIPFYLKQGAEGIDALERPPSYRSLIVVKPAVA